MLGLCGTAAEASSNDPQQRRVAWKLAEENSNELCFTWSDFSMQCLIYACHEGERGRWNQERGGFPDGAPGGKGVQREAERRWGAGGLAERDSGPAPQVRQLCCWCRHHPPSNR